jgi:hypothetical protein
LAEVGHEPTAIQGSKTSSLHTIDKAGFPVATPPGLRLGYGGTKLHATCRAQGELFDNRLFLVYTSGKKKGR